MSRRRNIAKAVKARLHGARWARTIADEAHRAGVPYAVAFASIEQESTFRNVVGHDNDLHAGQRVTNAIVTDILKQVARGHDSNGVGLPQLTYEGYIRGAHAMRGGGAKVRNQLRVGFKVLHDLHRQQGSWHNAFGAYNGGPNWRAYSAAQTYARVMDVRVAKWERWLALGRKR